MTTAAEFIFCGFCRLRGRVMGSPGQGFAPGRLLIILGGIKNVFGEDLAGGSVRGGDVVVVDEHQHVFAAMGRADVEVADFAGVAQRDFSIGIDPVGAGAVFSFSCG